VKSASKVKILPEALAGDPQFRDRFDREARAISQLTHPNICTLYDVGHEDGTAFLVLEFLEGTTLEDRLKQGALPLDQALTIATQIADALNAAHRQGIVHRDLKPGNVMLTKSGAKLLDFGLAKAGVPPAAGSFSMMPTTPPNLTQQGAILGTFQYMAPEQLEGDEADARTDIFAFGAVLYEMIAGRRAFEGRSQASLISAIMTAAPRPLAEQQPSTPPALEHLIGTCLKRDPNDRWQTAHDLLVQLRWVSQTGSQGATTQTTLSPRRAGYKVLAIAASAVALALVGAVALLTFRAPRGTAPADHIQFVVPTSLMPNPYFVSVSPDGRHIAYVAATAPPLLDTALFVRDLDSTAVRQLAGTEGAQQPFWSPDSRSIGFNANGKLRRVDIIGGPPETICDARGGAAGTWNQDGVIVFSSGNANVLTKVSTLGGEPTPVTTLNRTRHEAAHLWPFFLPDGHHFLYSAWSDKDSDRAIYVGTLDSSEAVRVIAASSMAMYADGFLLYQRGGTLVAQKFDVAALRVSGEPVRIADDVPFNPTNGRAAFAVSQGEVLVYRGGAGAAAIQRFEWVDSTGKDVGAAIEDGPYTTNFDLSLDGKQIALSKVDPNTNRSEMWLTEWARAVSTRFTFDSTTVSGPGTDVVFSPDGQQVAYSRNRTGSADIYMKNASGLGDETVLASTPLQEWVEDWSKDGRYLVYTAATSATDDERDLRVIPLFGDRKSFSVLRSKFRLDEPHFSFDTRWLAYASLESGTWQVNVISFPAADQKRQISTGGGSQPRWRRDGRELYYLALDGKMMAVDIAPGPRIESGTPRVLFDTHLAVDATRDQYAVMPDGQRFLLLKPVTGAAPEPITIDINWQADLGDNNPKSR